MTTLRQDETDVNFLDIKPEDSQRSAMAVQSELEANRRAWEKLVRTIDYVKKTYPADAKLLEDLDVVRHHLEKRL